MSKDLIVGQRSKGYTIIANDLFWDRSLSLKATGLLCYLYSVPDSWDLCAASIAQFFSDGTTSVSSALKELIDAGYVRRENNRNNGHFGHMHYYLFEEALPPGTEVTEEMKKKARRFKIEGIEIEDEEPTVSETPEADMPETGVPSADAPSADAPFVDAPPVGEPSSDYPVLDSPLSENPIAGNPLTENQPHSNTISSNTIPIKKEKRNNYPANTIQSNPYPINTPDEESEIERIVAQLHEMSAGRIHEMLRDNVEYDSIVSILNRDMLDSLLDYMLEMCCCVGPKMHVASTDYRTSLVQWRIITIRRKHIEMVLQSLFDCYSDVKNQKNYIMTVLFNASPTYTPIQEAKIKQWFG